MAKLPLIWKPAKAIGGAFRPGAPIGVAVHSTESENTPAMAESLAGPNWFGGSKAGTSAHKVVDVDSICEGVRRATVAFHAGPGGNAVLVAYEFCGRASWSVAKWREPAQLQMLRNAAPHIADDLRAMGAPARWLSLAQLAAAAKSRRPADGGMCTHNDIRLALGGTTHSDPGPNFPYAELLAFVRAELAGHAQPPPAAGRPAATSPLAALLAHQEETVQLQKDQSAALPVPPIPAGFKAVLSIVGDSVHGAVVYSKGQAGTAAAGPVLTDKNDWKLWVPPGKREDRDVSGYQVVHLVSLGAESHPEATAAAIISVVPA